MWRTLGGWQLTEGTVPAQERLGLACWQCTEETLAIFRQDGTVSELCARKPHPRSCNWVVGLPMSDMPETPLPVLVCWGESVWSWRKSQETNFCRKTVSISVWSRCSGQVERNMEELGLLGGGELAEGWTVQRWSLENQNCSNTTVSKSECIVLT